MGSGVQPRVTAPHPLHVQFACFEIEAVEVRDLQLAARGGFHLAGELRHALVIEIEPGHSPVRARLLRLFLDRQRFARLVQFDDPIGYGVFDAVAEHGGGTGLGPLPGAQKHVRKSGAVEDIVAQHQRGRATADKAGTDLERLGQAFRADLDGIVDHQAQL